MSTIPNSAMPHAGPAETADEGGETLTISRRAADLAQSARNQAGKLVDLARDNPKTAIAAGAALAAGAAAAAAIPLVRAKRRTSSNGAAAPKAETAKAPAASVPPRARPHPGKASKRPLRAIAASPPRSGDRHLRRSGSRADPRHRSRNW